MKAKPKGRPLGTGDSPRIAPLSERKALCHKCILDDCTINNDRPSHMRINGDKNCLQVKYIAECDKKGIKVI